MIATIPTWPVEAPMMVFGSAIMLLVPGYFILQTYGLIRWRGKRRKLALLPLIVSVPAAAVSIYSLQQGSNLWPIWTVLTSPPCALFLLVILLSKNNDSELKP